MGRTATYRNAAEKQKAYRQRIKDGDRQLELALAALEDLEKRAAALRNLADYHQKRGRTVILEARGREQDGFSHCIVEDGFGHWIHNVEMAVFWHMVRAGQIVKVGKNWVGTQYQFAEKIGGRRMILLVKALKDFDLANQADGLAAKTTAWYRWLLADSPHSLTIRFANAALDDLSTAALREYVVWLRSRRATRSGELLSAMTVRDYLLALHRFFGWCAAEYGIANPMKRISRPNQKPQPRTKAISLEEVGKMMAACDRSTDIGIRNLALLAFLIDTGCRAGGVCGLRRLHLDLEERTAAVTEKGNRTRLVCFTARTAVLLDDWLKRSWPRPTVFYNMQTMEALTTDGLAVILKKIGKRASVERCNPHSFRHAFAREYLLAGGDMATLSILLGHSQITTTADYYTVFTQREVARKHEAFSPMNRIAA